MLDFYFDEQNLRETAEAVIALNPFAEAFTVEKLIEEMKGTAADSLDEDLGYVSILGYVLSAYNAEYGRIGVKASVSSFLVKEYIKSKGKS